jgi:hypothetical protein
MSQPDLGEILAKAQQMQERLAEVQRELLHRKVEASAGGGMGCESWRCGSSPRCWNKATGRCSRIWLRPR